ncbi:MAG: DUF5667 domain-containing protein [Candidatus Humimicrobiaceae bacterium]
MFKVNKTKVEEKIINKFISLLDKGYDTEYCFNKFPFFKPYRREIDLYLDALNKIKDFKSIEPSENFKKDTLKKIYQNTQSTENNYLQKNMVFNKSSKLKRPFFKPVITFISTFLFLTFSYTGAVFASENSIPGDILYNVKISAENIQTSFTPYSKQGPLHFRFSNRRMGEAIIILNKNINISDEEMNNLLKSIDLEFQKCNEHHYLNNQESETLNNEINGIKTQTQKRIRKRDGSGNDNNSTQSSSTTDTSTSGNEVKGSSDTGNKCFSYGNGN